MIVPDTIEPYIGWKSLEIEIDDDGQLCLRSPLQLTKWPVGERLEADCGGINHLPRPKQRREWKLVKGTPPIVHYYVPGQLSDQFLDEVSEVPRGMYYSPSHLVNYPPPPDLLPPEGHFWKWEVEDEDEWLDGLPIASSECSCGIYCVSDVTSIAGYFRKNCVMAQVAVWGSVTPASGGARGQYAYPQKLLIPEYLRKEGVEIAERYQVPYEFLSKAGIARTLVGHEEYEATAREASAVFMVLAAGMTTVSSAMSLFGLGLWTVIPMGLGLSCLVISILAALDSTRGG